MDEIKRIRAEDFAELNFEKVTVLDLREPDEVLINGIEGAINIPFSRIGKELDSISREKPVYVLCRTGDWSEEVTELLMDRGYEAIHVDGGFKAYAAALRNQKPLYLDAKPLRCPGPIVQVADTMKQLRPGQQLFVEAPESAFTSASWRSGPTSLRP